jgi:energy-coupling factor transporter transmembrane protein EcfT
LNNASGSTDQQEFVWIMAIEDDAAERPWSLEARRTVLMPPEGRSVTLAIPEAVQSLVERTDDVGLILLVLLLVLIFAGAGFALHVLWIIAAVLLVLWLLGFLVSGAEHSWYRVQRR